MVIEHLAATQSPQWGLWDPRENLAYILNGLARVKAATTSFETNNLGKASYCFQRQAQWQHARRATLASRQDYSPRNGCIVECISVRGLLENDRELCSVLKRISTVDGRDNGRSTSVFQTIVRSANSKHVADSEIEVKRSAAACRFG